jgi:hypothetical protein
MSWKVIIIWVSGNVNSPVVDGSTIDDGITIVLILSHYVKMNFTFGEQ